MDPLGVSGRANLEAEAIDSVQRAARSETLDSAGSGTGPTLGTTTISNPQNDHTDSPAEGPEDSRITVWGNPSYRLEEMDRALPRGFTWDRIRQSRLIVEMDTGTLGAPSTKVKRFVESLPVLPLLALTEDDQVCPICKEQYCSPQYGEHPVRLPCDHVMGKDCLLSWLASPGRNSKNNTCPMCRAVLIERNHSPSVEDLDRRISQVLEIHRSVQQSESARLGGEVIGIRSIGEIWNIVEQLSRRVITLEDATQQVWARVRPNNRPRTTEVDGQGDDLVTENAESSG